MAGLSIALNATVINQAIGKVAQDLNEAMENVNQMAVFLATWTDEDLAAFGLSTDDITKIRSAYTDLKNLYDIYRGAQTLPAVYDHKQFARLIWGFGFQP